MARELILVRHAESVGNVARAAALEQSAARIALAHRDRDVPLSPLGERQAEALGRWLRADPPPPDVVYSSPYERAAATARIATRTSGWSAPLLLDERLREKAFGELDGLTSRGIREAFPAEAQARARIGKFAYRPPDGESWADVVERLRDFWNEHELAAGDGRVVIVTHQVVVLCLRMLIERLDERELMSIDRAGDVANCGVTRYVRTDDGRLALAAYNSVAPLERDDAPVTTEPARVHAG